MKLLTVGIDGGDSRIIERMPMPFLQSLLKDNQAPRLRGDLYSRGWTEIYTGKHCLETGAFYMHPMVDGSHGFTQEYNYPVSVDAGVTPLWESLNRAGTSAGVMNIPTTSPAPGVDGFFVSGEGGGRISKTEGLPETLCDSAETREMLEALDYIPDQRLSDGDLKSLTEMFDRLDRIIEIRKRAFLRLCEVKNPDFGFLCFRVTTTVQDVAMSEMEALLSAEELAELGLDSHPGTGALTSTQQRIYQHYRLLDEMIREVFETLHPEEYILCADHGAASYKYRANANSFLEEAGYLSVGSTWQDRARHLAVRSWRAVRSKLPWSTVRLVKKIKVGKALAPMAFDPWRTRAFGHWHIPGIYINDQRRFGGPVSEGEQMDGLVDEICACFNAHPTARDHAMTAKPFRRLHRDSPFFDKLPDIFIEKPDEMFFAREPGFVTINPNYGPVPENIERLTDMNSGQMGRDPLFAISAGLTPYLRDEDARDPRLVHALVTRYFDVST